MDEKNATKTEDAEAPQDATHPAKRDSLKKLAGIVSSLRMPVWLRSRATALIAPAAALPAAQAVAQAASPLMTAWLINKVGTGDVLSSTTGDATANLKGTKTNVWKVDNKHGAHSNASARFVGNANVATSQIPQIMDLSTLAAGEQLCVWWTLFHPTSFGTGVGGGLIWYWGAHENPNVGGWGVGIDNKQQFLRFEMTQRANPATHPKGVLVSHLLDANQSGMTLAVKKKDVTGTNQMTSCCVVIERSAKVPHLIIKVYVQPQEKYRFSQTSQTMVTVSRPDLMPMSGTASKLVFLGRVDANAGTLPNGYSLCNWGACRRAATSDNIGARIAKNMYTTTNAGAFFTVPASADDVA